MVDAYSLGETDLKFIDKATTGGDPCRVQALKDILSLITAQLRLVEGDLILAHSANPFILKDA